MDSYYEDLTEPNSGVWTGLYAQVIRERSPSLQFETSHHRKFRLVARTEEETPILWGKITDDFYGSDILKSYRPWAQSEMPIAPITSQEVEASPNRKGDDWNRYWTHFFHDSLISRNITPLHAGRWLYQWYCPRHKTDQYEKVPLSSKNRFDNEWIFDVASALDQAPCEYCQWDARLYSLKPRARNDASRVKWWRKKVRENRLPPLLVWFVPMMQSYLLLDGHERLLAALLEETLPEIVTLSAVDETRIDSKKSVQQIVMQHLADHANSLSTEKTNEILISHFDTRPHFYSALKTKGKHDHQDQWATEVLEQLTSLGLEDERVCFGV